jgi:hypothetical protein
MPIGRWISLPLAAISLVITVGCGSVDTRLSSAGTTDTAPTETTDVAPTDTGDASDFVPAVEEMSVFSRPRTEADLLPGGVGLPFRMHCPDVDWFLRVHGVCPGEALGDKSRLLLSGLGVRDESLYAWPTSNGWVCWTWGREGGGACVSHFTEADEMRVDYAGIDPDHTGSGYPGTLIGIVPDDVVAAQVQVDGVAQAAIVESNAIFYELPDGACTNWAFESLTATYRDGSSNTVPIRWHNGPGNTPTPCPT